LNTSTLKSYAPEARQAFITAVSAQASRLGISATEIQPAQTQGDVLLIAGQAFPLTINEPRNKLVERVRAHGFDATMDAVAYTWFNRFVAIRYMELHGYMGHGYRVLSHPEGLARPEILDHAADVELPGLDKAKAIELKLDGTQDEALYRLLLKAQCHALHQAMPFLFEKIGDETELLLPANLLHSDSLIRQLVEQVEETLWEDIEIIGWLYQFYISEKKDQVIGKVVKSEDIPAATQLFTPNWIVKYMVQNSLGAQWLATYPQSPLKGQMEYYIEPAKQTDEVNAQLAEITPSQLNPEELTLIDPASGSGHILVEAYELFKAIYLERGYRLRDVPQLILEKNLFGLDIDQRAAQLTGFALMMKGRADDRRLFERGVQLNVMALVDSSDFDAEGLSQNVKLADYDLKPGHLTELKQLFEHATTFGSLIQVSATLAEKLPALKQLSETATSSTDLFAVEALKCLGPLVQQAKLLAAQYDAVVANPPYMGSKFYCAALKDLVNASFKAGKSDLYGAFTLRNIQLAKELGYVGMITIPNWMFLSSFKDFRDVIFEEAPISSLVHNGRGIWGSDFGSCSYVLQRSCPNSFCGKFLRLFEKQGSVANNTELEQRFHANPRFTTANSDFRKIPGKPVAYWASEDMKSVFETCSPFSDFAKAKKGMFTGNNERFLRYFWEVAELYQSCQSHEQSKECSLKWYPYQKGGEFRKWYGNREYVVNFQHDGLELRESGGYGERSPETYFRAAITWNDITAAQNAFRMSSSGFLYDGRGPGAFLKVDSPVTQLYLLGLLNTRLVRDVLLLLNPTLSVNIGEISNIPVFALGEDDQRLISDVVEECILLSQTDWDAYERSWDFQSLPLLTASSELTPTLESSYTAWITQNRETIVEMKRLEEENNRLFIDAYGLADELTPDVPIEQITLTVNPAYRYGKKLSEEELWTRFSQDSMEELVSYAIGCMMGRYSLDAPGLVYANSGNMDFDASRYTTFPADDDGIVPLSDTEWFDDDAANRLVEFISVAWDASQLEGNLTFLADNLSPKANEVSRDTIRRYLCDKFFKDHLKTYKKRPIYWLFTSGKQKAFSCLVYLHRYNEGTLSRMRSEYVIPLQGKMAARLDQLKGDIQAATSTAHSKRLEKEQTKLEKQQVELIAFDEKLRHYADKRIALDLDDGVKENYGQFGDLLAEVKAIHGKKPATI
jgi:type II restriction/modification system DNA methylase subunit YeeA